MRTLYVVTRYGDHRHLASEEAVVAPSGRAFTACRTTSAWTLAAWRRQIEVEKIPHPQGLTVAELEGLPVCDACVRALDVDLVKAPTPPPAESDTRSLVELLAVVAWECGRGEAYEVRERLGWTDWPRGIEAADAAETLRLVLLRELAPRVAYVPGHGQPEEGVVVRLAAAGTFVLYDGDSTPKLTPTEALRPVNRKET